MGLLRSRALRVTVTLLVLGYFVATIEWGALWNRLDRADPRWLAIACPLLGLAYVLSAVRWWFLLRVQQIFVPLGAALSMTFIAQFFNAFMLGAVGGDVVKTLMVVRYAPNQKTNATLSIFIDRVLGLMVLLLASIAVLPWQGGALASHPEVQSVVHVLTAVFAVVVAAAVVMALLPFHRSPEWLKSIWVRVPRRHVGSLLVSGYKAHYRAWQTSLAAIAAAFGLTLVLITAGWCIARAIGVSVSFVAMLEIFTVATCVISLPISIGGHGVREGIFVFMFAAYGLITLNRSDPQLPGPETAILFSLLFFALSSVWSVVGGLVYLLRKPAIRRVLVDPG